MLIEPKIRGFICTTAHPTGCAQAVKQQIDYVKEHGKVKGPKRVLVIGASTGYGLASRIMATFGSDAKTIGVFFEKEAQGKRTASAGWYNSAAFEQYAHQDGHYAKSINGDAFSNEIKQQTAELIAKDLGQVDLVIYSVASPRRLHPVTGQLYTSVLKPIGQSYTNMTVDTMTGAVKEVTLEAATEQEITDTVAVMGGEDWQMWMDYLLSKNLLAENALTLAYSYIGPQLTFPMYRDGTIGRAKVDLENTAHHLTQQLQKIHGRAYVSVNKALVTQSSAAIAVIPLYISILFKVMQEKGLHEKCIEQIYRLFKDRLYQSNHEIPVDNQGLIRLDELEMREDVQQEVSKIWAEVNTDNLKQKTAIAQYRRDFYELFGFDISGVNYQQEVDPAVEIPSLEDDKIT